MRRQAKPRTEKTARLQDQRKVARERQAAQELRRRIDQPELLPVRDEGGVYRP